MIPKGNARGSNSSYLIDVLKALFSATRRTNFLKKKKMIFLLLSKGFRMPSPITGLSCWQRSCSKLEICARVCLQLSLCRAAFNVFHCWITTYPKCFLIVTQGAKIEPDCSLECRYLTSADYKDLLWTTLAEFPGKMLAVCSLSEAWCAVKLKVWQLT